MQKTIGLFADYPSMPTGMATVCSNLALNLSKLSTETRIIYFGRFGQERGFSKQFAMHNNAMYYDLCNSEGGVWNPRTVIEAVEYHNIDYILSEDDFFSASGLIRASMKTKKPLHLICPIDSLPIHPRAYDIFNRCTKVYIPNSSYKLIKNGVYLPHGVDSTVFFPESVPKDLFTFVWVGRDEPRKALGRTILAFQRMYKKAKCQLLIHSDWRVIYGKTDSRIY